QGAATECRPYNEASTTFNLDDCRGGTPWPPLLISPPFSPHLAETSQPAQQQQRRCRLWNRRRRRTRAFHHDVVDAIVPRRRGRAIEHNAKRRIRVVIQPGNTHKRKDERQTPERSQRSIRSSEVDEVYAVETVLKLITVKASAGSLSGKAHDDI